MSSQTAGSPRPLELRLDGERDLVARRQLVHEALALRVVQERALAAHRLGHEEAVARALEPQRRGVELHELEVGEQRARLAREAEPRADRAARVGGALPTARPSRRWRGSRRARRARTAPPSRGRSVSPAQRPSAVAIALAATGSSTRIRSFVAASADSVARDPAAGGRAAGVDDAPPRVPALEPEGEVAARGRRRTARRSPGGRPRARATPRTAPAPRWLGPRRARRRSCPRRAARASRRPRAPPRFRPAPSSSRSGRAGSGSRARRSRPPRPPRGRRRGRRRRPRRPRRRCWMSRPRARGVRYRRACRRSSATESSLEHDTGFGHPERADRIRAIEGELESRDWLGWDRVEAPRGHRGAAPARAPARVRARRCGSTRSAVRPFDMDTPTSAGLATRRRCGRPAAPARWWRRS